MRVRILFFILVVLLFIPIYSFARGEEYLDDLIQEALENNPEIKSLGKNWESKKSKILSEKTLPQPEARFMYFGESIQTKTGPQDKKYGIAQKIPFPYIYEL